MATARRDGRDTGPELTEDPFTRILERGTHSDGTEYLIYEQSFRGDVDRWRIDGTCVQCGQCEWNSDRGFPRYIVILDAAKQLGDPMYVADVRWPTRRDVPVRPEIAEHCDACSLRGEYLP